MGSEMCIRDSYSGVAILSKIKPKHIEYGCGIEKIDFEGRVIRADYDNFSVMSVYFPSGSSGDLRQAFKMDFLDQFLNYINTLKKTIPHLILSGDYNICHKAIDIHNPIRNKNTSGFLPEEREMLSELTDWGLFDSYRSLYPEKDDEYSWFDYRSKGFEDTPKRGLRIDHIWVTHKLNSAVKGSGIDYDIRSMEKPSDHAPIWTQFDL